MADSVAHTIVVLVEQLDTILGTLSQVPNFIANEPGLVVHLTEERTKFAGFRRHRANEGRCYR